MPEAPGANAKTAYRNVDGCKLVPSTGRGMEKCRLGLTELIVFPMFSFQLEKALAYGGRVYENP